MPTIACPPLHSACAWSLALIACSSGMRPDPDGERDAAPQDGSTDRFRSGSSGDAATDGGDSDSSIGHADGGTDGVTGAGDAATAGASADTRDAGACASTCKGDTPVCDPSTGDCVQCLRAEDCEDDDLCSGAHTCVECTRDEHCNDPAASYCNTITNRCEGCLSDVHCARFEATPECDERTNRCGACTDDTEDEHCGTFSCSRADLTCTTTRQGSLLACYACQADSECATGLNCVEHHFGQGAFRVSLGSFCFYRKSTNNGCADVRTAVRPYSEEVNTRSVDRVQDVYCLPITSCAAINDATAGGLGGKSCTGNQDCGVPDVVDGYCMDLGGGDMRCSYLCSHNYQCLNWGFTQCSNMPGMCEPTP
jgi:hypothetical protein